MLGNFKQLLFIHSPEPSKFTFLAGVEAGRGGTITPVSFSPPGFKQEELESEGADGGARCCVAGEMQGRFGRGRDPHEPPPWAGDRPPGSLAGFNAVPARGGSAGSRERSCEDAAVAFVACPLGSSYPSGWVRRTIWTARG